VFRERTDTRVEGPTHLTITWGAENARPETPSMRKAMEERLDDHM
jgi:hypothetical protein